MTTRRPWRLSRRGFLVSVGVAGTGLALGYLLGLPAVRLRFAETIEAGDLDFGGIEAPPMAWFEITPDNRVRFYAPKIEMGQGIHTALAQIAAEELEVDWSQLEVHQSTSSAGPFDPGGTSGSTSVSSLYQPLREAAATMREMLRLEAARQLGVPAGELVIGLGVVSLASDPSRRRTYGELVAAAERWEVPETPPALKPRDQFRYIGTSMPRVDFPEKLVGAAVYGYDARLPGMLYGAVARPPAIGATLRRAAPGDAASQPGVAAVVATRDFAGVAAESRSQAYTALFALDLEWQPGPLWQQADIEAMITVGQGSGVEIQRRGDAPGQLRGAGVISAEYRTPMAAHAHLEAQAALVDVQADVVRVWVSTQFPSMVRDAVAAALNRRPETIHVTPTFLGGGFGRKSGVEPAVEAARLAQASGRPVHIGWSRTEDMRHGYVRPPTHHVLRARLENGWVVALQHEQASGHVAFDFVPGALVALLGADFGAWRGATIPYGIAHVQTTAWRNELPVRTGWWRGLGLLANTFAVESFIDELASTAGVDPLQFRLNHLPDSERGQRMGRVLEVAATLGAWREPVPAGRARGLACCVDHKTIVAQVAEVSVEQGTIRVHRVAAVVDPGLVVNPDGARAQTEGSIVMGLSSTLLEELTVADSLITAANFDGYPLLTIKETPEITVELLESGNQPYGMGEPPIGPVAAAVANAVFALTGLRLRRLPLRLA